MAIDKKYNNLTRKSVVIPAYSVATVEYNDSMPNYYRVMNMGDGKLYCGTSAIPTTHRFEFSVGPQKIKLYTEPSRRNNLYIYNPSGVDVGAIIISFEAEFDPATLALADLEFDMSEQTVQSETVITGFNQPLPAGTNNIGKVTVGAALPAGTNNIGKVTVGAALPAGTNNIGKVTVTNPFDEAAILKAIENVNERVTYYHDVLGWLSKTYEKILSGTATAGGLTLTPDDGYRLNEVCFLSNDGTTDIVVSFIYDTITQSITIKGGETLNNTPCYCDSIKVSGDNVPFRLFATERKKV